jgi:hypothetical protein
MDTEHRSLSPTPLPAMLTPPPTRSALPGNVQGWARVESCREIDPLLLYCELLYETDAKRSFLSVTSAERSSCLEVSYL